ncbi:hypothetical protein EYC84_001766 [Monilinia fructicola]|uniref:Uncharacterized protein n=1 Tax=Monilinia fructicola TaxID=38448 RepID=A0A5M9JUL5_MONFR|nr:hypothetical protein EYC84_001766 [Monilinia fructicola]
MTLLPFIIIPVSFKVAQPSIGGAFSLLLSSFNNLLPDSHKARFGHQLSSRIPSKQRMAIHTFLYLTYYYHFANQRAFFPVKHQHTNL